MDRQPAVAGQFYPNDAGAIRVLVEEAGRDVKPREVAGAVLPHAGYVFSGYPAARTLAHIQLPATAIILGVTHRAVGAPLAVWPSGAWSTPVGPVEVDGGLAGRILETCSRFTGDHSAHMDEHSIEVQLPLLRVLAPETKVVPIGISLRHIDDIIEAGRELASAIRQVEARPVLLASSDMTHYEPDREVRRKDRLAIEQIEKLDPEGLAETVNKNRITMCGVAPTTLMLSAARELGATRGELIDYRTSGDAIGDGSQVVGYAGMIVY